MFKTIHSFYLKEQVYISIGDIIFEKKNRYSQLYMNGIEQHAVPFRALIFLHVQDIY
jgi:hypothetical protein